MGGKKFWLGLGLAAIAGIVGVKFIAEPIGNKLAKSTNPTVAKLGNQLS